MPSDPTTRSFLRNRHCDGLSVKTVEANRTISRSNVFNIYRTIPLRLAQTWPVNVWCRNRIPAQQAASMASRPALGVILCTAENFSLRNTDKRKRNARRSLNGDTSLAMFTSTTRMRGSMRSDNGYTEQFTQSVTGYKSAKAFKCVSRNALTTKGVVATKQMDLNACAQ